MFIAIPWILSVLPPPPDISNDDEGEGSESSEDPFADMPRFFPYDNEEPVEFTNCEEGTDPKLPSLTSSDIFSSEELSEDVTKIMEDLRFYRERRKLACVDSGWLLKSLYTNHLKSIPVVGAIDTQFRFVQTRLNRNKERLREVTHQLAEKRTEERKPLTALFNVCKNLRDAITFLGGEVSGFPLPNATAFEFAEWISTNSGSLKDVARNYGVVAGAAGIEEAFAQLSLSGGSVDPILDDGFAISTETESVAGVARQSARKLIPHWSTVGPGRISALFEVSAGGQNASPSVDQNANSSSGRGASDSEGSSTSSGSDDNATEE